VSDIDSGVQNKNGLDCEALAAWMRQNRTLKGFPGGEPLAAESLLAVECDVLVPAALGGVIDKHVAAEIRAKYVIEGANHPSDPDADEVLAKRGVVIVPDIYANAGGVTVSYFEWVQNIQMYHWDEARVNDELRRVMRKA